MKIYNTLTRKKEEFKPLAEGYVSMYHCGPTVYWTQHIGNMRAVVIADLINRSLGYLGYDVRLVRNYTDVGHLSGDNDGDADSGEDRMEKAAKREHKSPEEIARYYTDIYERDRAALNTLSAQFCPAATDHIQEMIALVETLLEKGFAYSTDLAIYFDVSKKEDYNKLSRQNINANKKNAGSGEVSDPNKKNPEDFALWFFKAGVHKEALQTWSSPFYSPLVENGQGFPGWHIECSAMAAKYLGETIDIHMGGIEHIPIHHTNEIAQSESAHGKPFAHYWIHNEHLIVDGGKMSKSEGTSYALDEVIERGFSALDLRYFFLQAHYRSKQNFTWDALKASQKALAKIRNQIGRLSEDSGEVNAEFQNRFLRALEDDFNIPKALASLRLMLKSDIPDADKKITALDFDHVLGLELGKEINEGASEEKPPEEALELLEKRRIARAEKNWTESDLLRDKIAKLGYQVIDEKDEQILKKLA